MSKLWLLALCALLRLKIATCTDNIEQQPVVVVVNENVVAPKLELMVNRAHVEANYYEPGITGEEYTEERRTWDRKYFEALEELTLNLTRDIVIKHKNYIQLASHTKDIIRLLTKYMPECKRLSTDGKHGRPFKDEFFGDALGIYKEINERSAAEAATMIPDYEIFNYEGKLDKQASKEARELAKQMSEIKFMVDLREFFQVLKQTVNKSPVGAYLDWARMRIDGKSIAELATKFLTHMRRYNGKSIKFLNMIMAVSRRFVNKSS